MEAIDLRSSKSLDDILTISQVGHLARPHAGLIGNSDFVLSYLAAVSVYNAVNFFQGIGSKGFLL